MAWLQTLAFYLRGCRKLLVALITIGVAVMMFFISLALLLKAMINGGQFVDVVKALGAVISTVVVAYMSTNMGKHLLDTGKEVFESWKDKRRKK